MHSKVLIELKHGRAVGILFAYLSLVVLTEWSLGVVVLASVISQSVNYGRRGLVGIID